MQNYWLLHGVYHPCYDTSPESWVDENPVMRLYFDGLLEYVNVNSAKATSVRMSIKNYGSVVLGFGKKASAEQVADYFLSGGLVNDTFNQRWNIYDGIPHPRNLTGCRFWTSWEIRWLLGFDICAEDGRFRSIRFACPESCWCGPLNNAGCPISCAVSHDEPSTPVLGSSSPDNRPVYEPELPVFPIP
eukprot:TRINITY_DN1681_c1_g1_i1.p1 TRINITY_DN1681_c1_g1~~TRINITY_DN1681_c1_g1_i1.p1  ORF type:complete len:207 (+),score=5.24 TRINITY_DN1681_c1_g1_i1:59-622(+)